MHLVEPERVNSNFVFDPQLSETCQKKCPFSAVMVLLSRLKTDLEVVASLEVAPNIVYKELNSYLVHSTLHACMHMHGEACGFDVHGRGAG